MMEWIDWNEEQPEEGEAMLVIFYNMVTWFYWINHGSVVDIPYAYDNRPVAWMRNPGLPQKYIDLNEQATKKWEEIRSKKEDHPWMK